MTMLNNNNNAFPSKTGYEDIENGYYARCGYETFSSSSPSSSSINFGLIGHRPAFSAHRLKSLDDRTPLLKGSNAMRPKCIDVRIFSLGVLFIGGITVGGYMLHQQDRPWPMTTAGLWLNFVNREDWGAAQLSAGRQLSSSNVAHILLHHTATENCFELSECKKFVYNYQKMWLEKEKIDIPYNYLIGGDGRAYEARGWHLESDHMPIHSNSSLSIAFIGNFTNTVPSKQQIGAAHALILELKYRKKIAKNYHILGVSYHNRANHDAVALFRATSEWKFWDEVFTVYS